jgi:hypothetical protein
VEGVSGAREAEARGLTNAQKFRGRADKDFRRAFNRAEAIARYPVDVQTGNFLDGLAPNCPTECTPLSTAFRRGRRSVPNRARAVAAPARVAG